MTRTMTLASGVVAVALLSAGLAFGQQPKAADCKAPAKVEGQVVRVDRGTNKVTIKDEKGTTHEFQTSAETARDMKAGDRIEATLRQAPNC